MATIEPSTNSLPRSPNPTVVTPTNGNSSNPTSPNGVGTWQLKSRKKSKGKDAKDEQGKGKKKPSGKDKSNATSHIPCKFFMAGTCSMGSSCAFSHDLEHDSSQICKYYLQGNCKFGKDCLLLHINPEGKEIPVKDKENKDASGIKILEKKKKNSKKNQSQPQTPSQAQAQLKSPQGEKEQLGKENGKGKSQSQPQATLANKMKASTKGKAAARQSDSSSPTCDDSQSDNVSPTRPARPHSNSISSNPSTSSNVTGSRTPGLSFLQGVSGISDGASPPSASPQPRSALAGAALEIPSIKRVPDLLSPGFGKYSTSSHNQPISSPAYTHLLLQLSNGVSTDEPKHSQQTHSRAAPVDVGKAINRGPLGVPMMGMNEDWMSSSLPVDVGENYRPHSFGSSNHFNPYAHKFAGGDDQDEGLEHGILPSSLNDLLTPEEQMKYSSSFTNGRDRYGRDRVIPMMTRNPRAAPSSGMPASLPNGFGAARYGPLDFNKAPGSPSTSFNDTSSRSFLSRLKSPSDMDSFLKRLAETRLSSQITTSSTPAKSAPSQTHSMLDTLLTPTQLHIPLTDHREKEEGMVSPASGDDWDGPFWMEDENTPEPNSGLKSPWDDKPVQPYASMHSRPTSDGLGGMGMGMMNLGMGPGGMDLGMGFPRGMHGGGAMNLVSPTAARRPDIGQTPTADATPPPLPDQTLRYADVVGGIPTAGLTQDAKIRSVHTQEREPVRLFIGMQ